MLFVTQGVGILMLTMQGSMSGFIELLKRVDFQKPLPFRPAGTVFWEVASKCLPNILMATLASLTVVVLRPVLWDYALASAIYVLGSSLLVSATVFLVTIAFPDAGDASQRGFRGILIMLGILVLGSPGAGLLLALLLLVHLDPIAASIPVLIVNFGCTMLVSLFAGRLYDGYNPGE